MKAIFRKMIFPIFLGLIASMAYADTWFDGFSGVELDSVWKGNRDNFAIEDKVLNGRNAHPIQLLPLKFIEVGNDWDNYNVECHINIVMENLLVCTKGAIIFHHKGKDGYVFAIHLATMTVEVYRISNEEILLSVPKSLELKKWYKLKAEINGENMSFYIDNELIGKIVDSRSTKGAVGLAVQDALSVMFDDFSVNGPNIEGHGVSDVKALNKISMTWAILKSNR